MRKNVCPLIATSLLGTGYGGNYRKTGDMVRRLLPLLYALADELRIDIAIVTIEEEVFALTNAVKKTFLEAQPRSSLLYETINGARYLSEATLNRLRFLSAQAMRGELTLFVGAGASMGVGIPSWNELLNNVAHKLGIEGEHFKEFSTMDYYTKAAVLESRLKRIDVDIDSGRETPAATNAPPPQSRKYWGFGPYYDAVSDLLGKQQHALPDAEDGAAPRRSVPSTGLRTSAPAPRQLRTLGQFVAEETQSYYYSIVDATLASLPCKEVDAIVWLTHIELDLT